MVAEIKSPEPNAGDHERTECIAAVRKQLAAKINPDGSRGLDFESPQAEARRIVATWSLELVRGIAARRQFVNVIHRHADIVLATGLTRSVVEKQWQALQEIHVTTPDGRTVALFEPRNLLYGTPGCLFHLDSDPPTPSAILDDLARTSERGALRGFKNLFHLVMALFSRKQIEAATRKRTNARARKLVDATAQVPLTFGRTGTDGAGK